MTKPPSRAPIARVAPLRDRAPSSSSSSMRSSCPSLSQRISVAGSPPRRDRSRLRSRSIRSGGKNPNCRSTFSPRNRRRGNASIDRRQTSGAHEDRIPAWHVLPQTPGDLQMMLRLTPCSADLIEVRAIGLFDEQCVGGQQLEKVRRRVGEPEGRRGGRTTAPPLGPPPSIIVFSERLR